MYFDYRQSRGGLFCFVVVVVVAVVVVVLFCHHILPFPPKADFLYAFQRPSSSL